MNSNQKKYSSHDREWQLQEAKNRLSQVLNSAPHDGPQTITLHGKPTAVVVSFEEYRKLTLPRTSLSQFFKQSPLRDFELDLTRSTESSH